MWTRLINKSSKMEKAYKYLLQKSREYLDALDSQDDTRYLRVEEGNIEKITERSEELEANAINFIELPIGDGQMHIISW